MKITVRPNAGIFTGKLEPKKWKWGSFKAHVHQKLVEATSLSTFVNKPIILSHWLLKEAKVFGGVSQRIAA